MKVIEDLGSVAVSTTRKRHMFLVECNYCNTQHSIRKEQLGTWKHCKNCRAKFKEDQAKKKLELKEQTCTKCNQTKSLTEFHKDTSKLTGYRSVCKECRYELEKESNSTYLKTEAGKISSASRKGKRTSRIRGTENSTISRASLSELKLKQDNKCAYCNTLLDYSIPRAVHLDHVVPLSKGGTHTIDNVVWACSSCNLAKGDKLNIAAIQ